MSLGKPSWFTSAWIRGDGWMDGEPRSHGHCADPIRQVAQSLAHASPPVARRYDRTEVTIIDDDEPGVLAFAQRSYSVTEAKEEVVIKVERTNGADGLVSVDYSTVDLDAKQGVDYEGSRGTLEFANGVVEASFRVKLIEKQAMHLDQWKVGAESRPCRSSHLHCRARLTLPGL